MREHERMIMLQIVDAQWKDHLLAMDHLKEGIGLRGYGQRDPPWSTSGSPSTCSKSSWIESKMKPALSLHAEDPRRTGRAVSPVSAPQASRAAGNANGGWGTMESRSRSSVARRSGATILVLAAAARNTRSVTAPAVRPRRREGTQMGLRRRPSTLLARARLQNARAPTSTSQSVGDTQFYYLSGCFCVLCPDHPPRPPSLTSKLSPCRTTHGSLQALLQTTQE